MRVNCGLLTLIIMTRFIKNKEGFGLVGILFVIAIIALLGSGGLYVREVENQKIIQQIGIEKEKEAQALKQKIKEKNQALQKEMGAADLIDTTNWKTYRNEKYGFEVRYPGGWYEEDMGNGAGIFLTQQKSNAERPFMNIQALVGTRGIKLEEIEHLKSIDFQRDCTVMQFAGDKNAYDCYPVITFAGEHRIIFSKNGVFFEVYDSIMSETSKVILNTFKFIK